MKHQLSHFARHSIRLVVLAFCLFATYSQSTASSQADVPAVRMAALARGVNLNQWFSQVPDALLYDHDRLRNWINADDFSTLAKAGFTHVRFPIDFKLYFDEQNPSVLKTEYLPELDHALDGLQAAGLAAVVDFHARKDIKQRINEDPAFTEAIVQMWTAMARHLAARDHNHVFFEVMNEPVPAPSSPWWEVQGRVIGAIRAVDPDRTIVAAGDRSGMLEGLLNHQPYADRNVIYTFHFYDPILFTHQGASWVSDAGKVVTGMTYPADEANKAAVANSFPGFRDKIMQYQANSDALSTRIARVVDWAHSNNVQIYCGEFGVYGAHAPVDSRQRWLTDVRSILERDHIDWSMWDYTTAFGIAMDDNGHFLGQKDSPAHRLFNPDTLRSLGLGG